MSVKELVKEAHKAAQWDDSPSQILLELADKLEELAAENRRLNLDSLKVGDQMLAEKFRADKAEAALAEMKRENEVLREALYYYAGSSCGDGGDLAREVLARNAGGTDAKD